MTMVKSMQTGSGASDLPKSGRLGRVVSVFFTLCFSIILWHSSAFQSIPLHVHPVFVYPQSVPLTQPENLRPCHVLRRQPSIATKTCSPRQSENRGFSRYQSNRRGLVTEDPVSGSRTGVGVVFWFLVSVPLQNNWSASFRMFLVHQQHGSIVFLPEYNPTSTLLGSINPLGHSYCSIHAPGQ